MRLTNTTSSCLKQQFLRDMLQLAKKRMLSKNMINATITTTSSQLSISSSSLPHAIEQLLMNANIVEIVLGVAYILIIIAFIVKRLLKTLRQFEDHFGSSHDGAYNRFGFIANEDSGSSDNDSDDNNVDDDDVLESSSSSPVSLRHALVPLVTPLQKITTVTPHTPFPPPIRRSLRLKIKSELNLTALEKQNTTNVVTRSQMRQNQSHNTNEYLSISSEPAPSSAFNQSHAITTPSLHPENDEELEFYLQRCHERRMKKRSKFNSPLVVRRLVL